MTEPTRRTLRAGGPAARRELALLLASVWAAEAVRPSEHLIVAAPTLADFPALDNRAGGFSGLEPAWGERGLRVSDLVLRALSQGGEVWLFTLRQAERPNRFLSRICARAEECGLAQRLQTAEVTHLPVAGVFGDGYSLAGAIDFTDVGPDFASEGVVFEAASPRNDGLGIRLTFERLLA